MGSRHLTVSLILFSFDDCHIELMLKVPTFDILFYCFPVDLRLDKEALLIFREKVERENWRYGPEILRNCLLTSC